MSPQILRIDPGAEIEAYTETIDDKPVVGTIAIVSRDAIHAATVMSLMGTDYRGFAERGEAVERHFMRGAMLTWQRNELIRRMRGDWILFIDADMTWQPDAVERLVSRANQYDLEMLGALCFMRQEPHRPTLFMRQAPDHGLYNALETWEDGEVIEVDATGMAFCLIKVSVFEKIMGEEGSFPPYEHRMSEGGPPPNFFTWDGGIGEDLRFCQAAKAAGVKIFVDTGVKIGHIGEVTITEREYLMQLALRSDIAYEDRKLINEQMGLPTMSPSDAKEKLGWA